nr:NPCBM/NEW2 domain-containing protein [Pirellula sp.]
VDVVKRLASMEEMQTELRTRTVNRVQIEKKTSMREVLIDFEGRLRNVTQEVSRMVPVKKDYTEEYTVSIPVVKTYEETFSVTKPKLSYVQPSENSAKAVIQLSLPDLDIVGRWIPEGDRIPVGTSFNSDGSRIFVTTLSGVSALESKSMIELVDIRAKDDSGEEVAETVHHQSPFYIADREMLLTPNLNKLVSLKPDTKVDDAYFDDLAKSAKAFREQSLEQAKSAASRLPSITPSQSVSPGYGPQPPAPAAPKPQLKPLLAKVEAEKAEVKLTEYNFNELGLDEPIETNPKSYRLAELDHTEVIVADGVHSTKISLPEGFSTFSTLFGLPDNLSGTAHFVVRGDGRTIYRSNVIRDHRIHGISLDVRGVKRLELAVETMNRKSGSVAALWLEPTLHRKLLPDVYTMRFEELRLKIEKFVGLDFRLDRNGLTTIGVLRSDPTVTTTGGTWRPKTNRTFAEKDLLSKLRGDLNFAHARVYLAQDSLRNGPDVAYSYHSDHVRVQCLGPGDCELIIQIPYRTTEEVNAPHEPRWTGKWRVGVWNYSAEERVTPTKDIPPKGEKPLGVLDVESIDWEWNNEAFPSANAPNDRFLMVGERKFESSGGLYQLETLSDDGVRIKLDDEIIIDNWLPQAVTQNTTMVEIKPGMHKLRFEYFEDLGPSRLSLSIRCIDPNQAELKELESVNSKESAEIRKQRESIDYLRSIGVYLFEELNAPTPKIYRVDLAEADPSKIDSTTIDRLMEFPAIRYLTVGPNAWNAKDWERLANLRSLQRLHLEYRSIDLDEFASVATFTQVKELSVLGNKLGDKEVEILSAMPNIQLLSFWYTELTDSCFETLAKMPNLREFHQGGSKITESAQRDFQAKLAEKQKR